LYAETAGTVEPCDVVGFLPRLVRRDRPRIRPNPKQDDTNGDLTISKIDLGYVRARGRGGLPVVPRRSGGSRCRRHVGPPTPSCVRVPRASGRPSPRGLEASRRPEVAVQAFLGACYPSSGEPALHGRESVRVPEGTEIQGGPALSSPASLGDAAGEPLIGQTEIRTHRRAEASPAPPVPGYFVSAVSGRPLDRKRDGWRGPVVAGR